MPVRCLTSSVRRWPRPAEVEAALSRWAQRLDLPGLDALGYFGSYARGDAGVGSYLDLVAIVEASDLPPPLRATRLPLEELPVPADALVYTEAEWAALKKRQERFAKTHLKETRWLLGPP